MPVRRSVSGSLQLLASELFNCAWCRAGEHLNHYVRPLPAGEPSSEYQLHRQLHRQWPAAAVGAAHLAWQLMAAPPVGGSSV